MWHRVIGQQRVKNILLSALRTGRLPHAYLFAGNEGVGKDAMALELARALHCEKEKENACGECASCLKLNTLQHPDVKLITALPVGKSEKSDDPPMEKLTAADVESVQEQYRRKGENPYHRVAIAKANIIKINSIREVRRESAMSSLYGGKKVFIISNADEMGDEASNTLLKTLEEPPGDTLLILTTSRPETLLQTIISRCQLVRFDPLTELDIRAALMERELVDDLKATLVARLANGSYVRALELLKDDVAALRQDVVNFVRTTLTGNAVAISEQVEQLASSKDREFVVRFLTLMLVWFRDAFVLLQGGSIINLDQQDDLKRFTAKFPDANLNGVMNAVEQSISLIYKNGYILLTLIQLTVRLRRAILEQSLQRI
ncbi:MAG: DNA polymerase III subunit delta' [Bacteroidetes bacterium]|nr:DNA polymerase III subunit delta' [Bacteroidota bacterium]MCW5897386.1 DNA polymerase III subunit delta' [Bacteroidota bacterium]